MEQVLVPVQRVLVQQLDYNLAHVIGDNEILEEEGHLIDITASRCVLQMVVRYILGNNLSGRPSEQQLEHDGPDGVDVAHLRDAVDPLISFHEQKLLYLVALQVYLAVFLQCDSCQLVKHFNLLR